MGEEMRAPAAEGSWCPARAVGPIGEVNWRAGDRSRSARDAAAGARWSDERC